MCVIDVWRGRGEGAHGRIMGAHMWVTWVCGGVEGRGALGRIMGALGSLDSC